MLVWYWASQYKRDRDVLEGAPLRPGSRSDAAAEQKVQGRNQEIPGGTGGSSWPEPALLPVLALGNEEERSYEKRSWNTTLLDAVSSWARLKRGNYPACGFLWHTPRSGDGTEAPELGQTSSQMPTGPTKKQRQPSSRIGNTPGCLLLTPRRPQSQAPRFGVQPPPPGAIGRTGASVTLLADCTAYGTRDRWGCFEKNRFVWRMFSCWDKHRLPPPTCGFLYLQLFPDE